MTSLLRILFDFDHPATVENLGVEPVETPKVDSLKFSEHLEEQFDRGEKRAAKEHAVAIDD